TPEHWRWREAPVRQGPTVVFDMDVVLSDASSRQHYLEHPYRDWDAFLPACGEDPLIDEVARLLDVIDDDLRIVLLTARPLRVRPQTIGWLARYDLRWDLLIMRDHGDYTASRSFKREAVHDLRAYGFDLRLAFEDDRRNVEMFHAEGVPGVYIHSGYYDGAGAVARWSVTRAPGRRPRPGGPLSRPPAGTRRAGRAADRPPATPARRPRGGRRRGSRAPAASGPRAPSASPRRSRRRRGARATARRGGRGWPGRRGTRASPGGPAPRPRSRRPPSRSARGRPRERRRARPRRRPRPGRGSRCPPSRPPPSPSLWSCRLHGRDRCVRGQPRAGTVPGRSRRSAAGQRSAAGGVEGVAGGREPRRGRPEGAGGAVAVAAGQRHVAADLVDRRLPRRQAHDRRGQPLGGHGVRPGPPEVAGAGGGDRRGHGEGDAAPRARLGRAADRRLGLLEPAGGGLGVGRGGEEGAVDPVEQVEADIGLAGDGQRLVEQGLRLVGAAPVERELGPALQRVGLAGGGADPPVQGGAGLEVGRGVVEPAGEQPGLAPQRDRECLAPHRAEAAGLGLERGGEGDDLVVGPGAVQEALGDAQLAVEHARRQRRERRRLPQ